MHVRVVLSSNASVLTAEVPSEECTVGDLKAAIDPLCTPPCPPSLMKLVNKGKILSDASTLKSYGAGRCRAGWGWRR